MPNCGSHAWRTWNWNSALEGLKRAHRYSVAANATSDVTSATVRTTPSRSGRSPRPPATRTRNAPTSGRKTIVESSISLPHQIPAEDDHDADEQRRGIRADRTRLQQPQPRTE